MSVSKKIAMLALGYALGMVSVVAALPTSAYVKASSVDIFGASGSNCSVDGI